MAETKSNKAREVYITDGARTPFLKAGSKPGPFSASDLAVAAGKTLLTRQSFEPSALGEVVIGCVNPSEDEANIARIIAIRLGCGKSVPGWTVQRNCGSGLQAIDSAYKDIFLGRHDLVLAGGTEAMSRAPLIYNAAMVNWFADSYAAKGILQKLKVMLKLPIKDLFSPTISLVHGLTDPTCSLIMGKTAENLAYRFNISREEMDQFAMMSHQRVAAAQDQGLLEEVTPLYAADGKVYDSDTGLRRDSSMEKLAKLKPFFDKTFGAVTAGNSAQVTDGASLVILASQQGVERYKLPTLGRIVDIEWAGYDPEQMGLSPVFATANLLKRHNLEFKDIDYWELNEAFAAQALACLKAWESPEFCKKELGLDKALGKIDLSKLNVDGGAVALGHPVGASGARIVLHLLQVLKRNNAKRGIATICIGGGQGGAILVER